MSEVTTLGPAADEPSDYKEAVISASKIDSLRNQMLEDQAEIERLKMETREIINRLKAA